MSGLSASDRINLGLFLLGAIGLYFVYEQIRLTRQEIKHAHRPWVWVDDVKFDAVQVGHPLVIRATVKNTGGSGVDNLAVFSQIEALAPRSSRSTYKPIPPRVEDIRLAGRDVVTFQGGIAPGQELPLRIETFAPKALSPALARDIASGAAVLEVVLTVNYDSPLLRGNEVFSQGCYYYDSQSQTTSECRAQGQAPVWPEMTTRTRTLSPSQ